MDVLRFVGPQLLFVGVKLSRKFAEGFFGLRIFTVDLSALGIEESLQALTFDSSKLFLQFRYCFLLFLKPSLEG